MNLGIGPHDHGIDFKDMDEIDKLNPEVQTPWYRHRHEQQVDPWFHFPLHSTILSVDATPTSLRFSTQHSLSPIHWLVMRFIINGWHQLHLTFPGRLSPPTLPIWALSMGLHSFFPPSLYPLQSCWVVSRDLSQNSGPCSLSAADSISQGRWRSGAGSSTSKRCERVGGGARHSLVSRCRCWSAEPDGELPSTSNVVGADCGS